jgi:hypothetical protein
VVKGFTGQGHLNLIVSVAPGLLTHDNLFLLIGRLPGYLSVTISVDELTKPNLLIGVKDVALSGDGDTCEHVVTGGHNRLDLARLKLLDHGSRLRFHLVFHDEEPEEIKFCFYGVTRDFIN